MGGKRRIEVLALAFGTLLIALAVCASTTGATTVRVDPATQDVLAGDPFSINVSIDNVTDMNADQATVNFDPTVMSAEGVTEGDFLKGGGATLAVGPFIDNVTGTVTFSYALQTQTGVNGSGVLATIDFDTNPAAPTGVYPLNLTNVLISDSTGEPITVDEILNGSVNITGREVPPAAKNVPTLSGIGLLAVVGILAVVLAVSLNAKRKRRH